LEQNRPYPPSTRSEGAMVEKSKRLEAANFERAEAAVRWEDAENRADETGKGTDAQRASNEDSALRAADRKIKEIESEP
jgi:hypothetical protein